MFYNEYEILSQTVGASTNQRILDKKITPFYMYVFYMVKFTCEITVT